TLSPCASQLLINSKYLYMLNDIKPLDMQVLRLTARGLTVKAIATELELSTRSIYRCRDKLREILGIQTIETLIDAAREQGLLDLEDDWALRPHNWTIALDVAEILPLFVSISLNANP